MQTLSQQIQAAGALLDRVEDIRREGESLVFCRRVYARFVTQGEAANEHMDAEKAVAQLLEAVDKMITTIIKAA